MGIRGCLRCTGLSFLCCKHYPQAMVFKSFSFVVILKWIILASAITAHVQCSTCLPVRMCLCMCVCSWVCNFKMDIFLKETNCRLWGRSPVVHLRGNYTRKSYKVYPLLIKQRTQSQARSDLVFLLLKLPATHSNLNWNMCNVIRFPSLADLSYFSSLKRRGHFRQSSADLAAAHWGFRGKKEKGCD